MSSRHAPLNGADAAPYVLHPYRVYLTDEVGARWWQTVSSAIGPNDARNQAVDVAHVQGYADVTALKIERIPGHD